MPKYIVREGEFIQHDGKDHKPGDVLSCTEDQAKALRVDPAGEKTAATEDTTATGDDVKETSNERAKTTRKK